jgi:membrane carboxypeptidase/penicillin-binding protein
MDSMGATIDGVHLANPVWHQYLALTINHQPSTNHG